MRFRALIDVICLLTFGTHHSYHYLQIINCKMWLETSNYNNSNIIRSEFRTYQLYSIFRKLCWWFCWRLQICQPNHEPLLHLPQLSCLYSAKCNIREVKGHRRLVWSSLRLLTFPTYIHQLKNTKIFMKVWLF